MPNTRRAILASVLLLAAARGQSVVLSDNLDMLGFSSEFASTTEYLTVPFLTDAQPYDLSTVVLWLSKVGSGSGEVLEIWKGATEPTSLVGTLSNPPSIPTGKSAVTFTADGIPLAPLSTYWVVLRSTAPATDYAWGWALSDIGSGVGFTGAWGRSLDAGGTWDVFIGAPLRMKVTAEVSPWTDERGGLPGVAGVPVLTGSGPLVTGTPGVVALEAAAPSALGLLFASLASAPVPFKGGFLVPAQPSPMVALVTGPAGQVDLAWAAWPAGLAGLTLYLQVAIGDAAAAHGVALSNALSADVP